MELPLMRVVVTGSAGRLGSALARELQQSGHSVVALRRTDLDITEGERVHALLSELRPDVIVNCSAYNAVDAAETDAARAFAINGDGPGTLAAAAAAIGARLVHFSTDFVFDGQACEPYREDALLNPLSTYGASKRLGEERVRHLAAHYILRVESLFGGEPLAGQRATVDYIAETLVSGAPIRAFVDRTVTPSHVSDVCRATRLLLEKHAPYGTYHCVASGTTNWYELSCYIARCLGVAGLVIPVRTMDVHVPAKRPRYCALSNEKLISAGISMPSWQAAVGGHLASRLDLSRRDAKVCARIA